MGGRKMRKCIFFALALISVAAALPLHGEETSELQVGMLPEADDEKTVSVEVAEVDMESGFPDPVVFIDTSSDDSDDLGEDDGDSDFQLMDGSDADIAKAIQQRIGQQVSTQLGSIPVQTGDVDSLKQFEQDKVEAEKFISMKKVKSKQDIASKQVMEEMAAAQKELKESQESNEELDKREDTDEGDERTKA